MATNAAHIALLFFSRTAGAEQLAKSYGPQGYQVHDAMISHAHGVGSQSALPIYWLDEAEQVGDTFGERLANAYESLFAKGYQKVIAIGNDCPNLQARDIKQAARLLQDRDWVLGPATDGGLYLLGLSEAAYTRESFLAFAWEKQTLLESLESYISHAAHTSIKLSLKADIDSRQDLFRRLHAWGSLHPLYWLLFILSAPLAERLSSSPRQLNTYLVSHHTLRAPPVNA